VVPFDEITLVVRRHISPKRKRGNWLRPSLALRASIRLGKLYHYPEDQGAERRQSLGEDAEPGRGHDRRRWQRSVLDGLGLDDEAPMLREVRTPNPSGASHRPNVHQAARATIGGNCHGIRWL
jgi:hypothetical protein